MSAVNESKIIHIKDEDLLKKMWHETEDFGRKKEIRAHMYKLREERLKDLYCNSDVKDIHLITNKKTSFNQSMHADALADHSFASLKRKEIRDSESPTKDISYRMKGPSINEGWNISKIEEHSQDGKNHKISQSAHTSGTEYIPQGKLDFEAKNNQELTTYHDGDDKNFVKSQGTSSNSFIRQEAVGGDGNSSFRTSSSQSSSSSRTVTEQKSTYGDAIDYPKQSMIDHGGNSNNFTSSTSVNTSRTDTNKDVGDYTRKQVILESANRDDQNNYRTSSTNATSSSKIVTESQKSQDDYSRKQVSDSDIIDRTTKVYTTDAPRELKSHPGYVEGRTKITRETKTLADGTVVTTTKYETKGVDEVKSASSNQYISSSSTFQDNKSNVITSKSHNENFSTQKVIEDRDKPSTKHQPKSRYYVEKTHTIPDTTENIHHNIQSRRESNVSEKKFDTTKNFQSHVDQRYEIINDLTEKRLDTKNTENVRNQTTQHIELEDSSNQRKENVRKETVDRNRVQQKTVATHDVNSVPLGTPIEIEINLTRINDNQEFKGREPQVGKQAVPKSAPENVYDTPKRREPIKHQDEITTKHKITDGQYDTTYRTDYTTKKISVEVSPTHDAFARSLRAVSPDRLSSRTSSRNLKSSNSSLRSSSSPEKSYTDRRHPQRMSPDRYTNGRYHSPTKKTPEKFSSTETITYKSVSRPNTQRISPDKSQRNKHTNEIKLTSNISTSTKKTEKTDDKTYKKSQSPPKNTPRTSIPNNEQRTNVYEITTDLDDNISTYSHSTVTTSKTDKRNSNVDSKTVEEFYINDRNKPVNENHPTKETPRKDKPIDRPLKRTDTYEERCRQILGITSDSNEKRRSSLEKLRKRGSTVQSPTDSPTKTSHESPEKKPHESPRQKSPTKQGVPLQEFPSQIRRSPEKCSPEKRTPKEPSPTKGRKPSVEGKNIQEYPSQTRKTPEKNDNTSFPRRSSDVRQERKPSNERKPIQEFPSQIRRTPEKYPPEDQNVTPKHTDSEKPSTHQKPLGEYPSQRHMSPDKKQSPSRSSPRKPNETNQETTNVDISSRTTSQLIMRDESENKNQATYSKDNIRIQTASNTSDTSYEQPSPTKHLPRKSLEKIAPAGSPDKHQRTTEVTTTLSSSLKNENITNITRNESLPDDGIPSIGKDRSKKPSHKEPTTTKHKPNNDSSSEENDIEVNQVKITEQVIYDIPRSAVHKISSDEVKTTDEERNTIILRTNINKQQNESNMKTITSDFISEEAQSLLIESAIDEQDDTETPLNTKRGPKDDKSPKSSQPIDKNQTKSKPFNLHDVRTVEQIDIVEDISMNKNTATEEKVTKSKTVGELVESFTLREEDNIRKPFEKPRDSYPNSCPMPKKSSLTKKYVNMVDVENSKITTNQIQINETIKQSSTDSKQPIQPKDGRPSSNEKPQKLDEIVKPNKYEDIELKKGSSINRTPTDKDLQKPSPQKTQKPDNEKDAKELVVETRSEFTLVSNKPSSTYIQKTNSRSPSRKPSEEKVQKSSKDSPHKRPQQDDNLMVIEVQETVTIESDEEIDESRQMFPSDSYPSQISKKIVHVQEDKEEYENSEESGHELTEIEFTTIKRIPNKESNEPLKKSPNKHQPQETKMPQKYDKNQKRDDKEIKQNTTNKTVVQKRIHTENISKEKDIKTLSQRTPSGSSLSKKPLIHQKLNKKEEVDVEVKNKVSTVRKSFERKQTKSDSVRKENAPHGRPMNGVPSKVHPSHKPISKKPLETVDKNKKPIKETPSNLDSDSSEAEEEIHTKKHVLETYEGRTPVEEPLIMKKTVSLLYSDDEDEKKATQLLIESEITEIQPITDQKKDRPTKSTKMTTTKLINSEKNERTVQKTKPSQKTPHQTNNMSKKPEIPKQPYLTNGVKKDTIKKETKQNTLKDIETFNTVNEDKKILLRSNRVDETVNKKKTSVMTTHGNTPINKSPDTPKTANGVPKRPSSRQTVTNEKITTRVTTKTKEPAKPTQKSNKPSIPQRSTMTSTVSSKTKTESKTTKTNAVKSNIKPVESKFKPKPKKIEEPEDSDEESLADSLDESVYSSMNDLTSTTQKTEIQTYTSENIEDLEKHQTSSVKSQFKSVDRTEKESESITEKKHKATKSIILNNKDRGTVDLQRSISSREPTPDRMCPLPVTSDEEGNAPRYPDKVVEPEESSPKKRYNRLFDTSIHEYGDIQSKKIVEINEDSNQKAIDRVDNDDESLLTVNKKINKFLSTAEKLTEKSVVDISQPAPKVHRPKFEVNDDLKEDDCLLSVSDKVQKFITEAEHLTTYKDTQHRKSVNVEVRSDVVDKINQFTSPQHQKEANLSPRKSSTPKNTLPSSFEETHPERKEPGKTTIPSQIKLDQDVFITTECAEIEKESDFFRASKNIPKDTKEKPEEHDTPKSSHESKSKKTEIKSTTKKTSVETDEFSYEDTQISEQTDETPTKPRKNSLKEFTPKNRRPSQEEKVILSSVGRLRSNESIKKAKALFDNTESSTREEKRQIDILNRPSVLEGRSKTVKETHSKKVIDRNNVTPKRLDFTTEKRTEDRQIKVESHKRQSSEKDVPRYMKPLDRQSKPEDHEHPRNDHPNYSGDRLGDSHENPGYMKPLDRSHKHPQESAAPESQDQRNTPKHSVHGYESHKHYTSTDWTYKSSDTTEDNTPVYMKPLDRTDKHHHSQTLSNSDYQEHKYAPSHSVPEDHKRRPYTSNEDDTPGYMKPIDRSHQHHHTSSTPDSQEHRSRPRHSAPEDDNRKHHSSTDWTYKSGTNEDEIPGYMKPLDRSSRPQFDSREPSKSPERHTSSERYHEGDKPGYMEPLDRSSRPQFDRREPSKSPERHTISERYHEGDKPGYMQPLDRSSRPQFDSRDRSKSPESHTTSERYHEGDKPGYMEPLDRSSRPQFDRREPSKSPERHSISERYHEGDKPGYMQPLDRSSRPQYDSRDRSKSPESHTSSERYHKGDKPGYMEPLDRSSRPQFDRRKPSKSPERHTISERYHEGDKPGYMQPLDRSSRPQFDSRDRSKSPESHNTSERYHEGDKPGYMEPLDRSSRPQFDRRKPSISPERHSISERYHEGDKPGYMQPLDRSSRPQFDSRDRSKTPETHTTSERYHESDKPGYMEPLDRSSRPQFDRREPSKSPERHTISERYHDGDKPSYMQPLDRSTRPQYDSRDRSKSPETKDRYKKPHGYKPSESGPEEDLPGYMKPLDRCDRSRSPKKDTGVEKKPQDTSGTPTKFGVTLKRTDSSKAVTSPKTTTDKKHPLLLKKQITEEEIEEVFDLEVLEELLLKFTIYELRRKIRTQIRIVKKLISEGKLEVTIQNMKNSKKHTEHTLQTRENTKKTDQHSNVNSKNANSTRRIQESQSVERKNKQEFSEYTVESSRKESFSSTYTSERQDSRRSKTPEKKIQERRTSNGTTPERASPERKHSSKPSSERNIVEERTTSVQERRTSSRPTPERASPERKHSSKPSSERNIVEERTTSVQERRTSSRPTPERASPERKHSTKPSSERNIVEERTTSVQERRTSNRTTPERASPERKYSSKPSSERNIVEERTTSTHSTYTVKEKNKTGESKPPTKTSSPNIFNSSLKKTEPKVKSPTSAPQPEWITQRNLKKTGTNEVVKKSSVSSSSSTIKRQNIKSTSTKESESTDLIASSYGIGPTDENGAPLFGLRALRAQNTNGTTKVQGTVISSQYYSETGKEPVGQISVTKYSSDPRDLGSDEHSTRNGDILSVTTTQKYGYDDTPSLKQLTSTDQEICDSRTNKRKSSTKTSTITRKNSVKALTQKFVENAVEVSKSERQSTYPKAGLILRSSSFKNESATEDGYSEISAEKRMGESVSIKTSHSKSASGGTFLRNKSKVTDVQDAITRMKAEDIQHGDTEEDIEAKDLLNKYLGTQVILSGIEGQVSRTGASTEKATSFSTSAKSVSRITTVTMENGKEVTRTRTFEHPLSDEVLESVWDEQTLRYLLDQSTDYEERKRLRARLRLIMAEQEACTELVKQASQDQSSQSIDGESLLLPLLQGLLDAPENEQTHDSGTESGEDQRSGLIAEVQNALDKLSMSLKSDATDITAERRSSLLQLVTKLQAGLSSATSDRRHSGQLRFNRRRERPDRHTIGVSNEELADARKLMQEISCPSQSSSKTSLIPKQNSEGSVNKTASSYNPINQKSSVKNATPKPFSCSNSTNASTDSSSVQTPSESMDCLGYLFNEETKDYPGSDTSPTNYNNRNIDNQASYKASQDYYNAMEDGAYPDHIPHKLPNIDSEDECSTIKPDTYAKPDLLMQSNPIYYQPNRDEEIDNKKNRFTTKKLKMRRANTIDIPKPLHFYECDDDEETDVEEEERRRRSNYLALRGPIRVGNVTNRNSVPALEPKTENDKKFLAFITKHNQKNQRHSMWASKTEKSSIWNNKFDHIKTNFEKNAEVDTPRFTGHFTDDSIRFGSKKYDPKISKQTAMNLKRMFEEKQRLSNERRNSVTTENSFKSRPVETEKNVRFIPQPLPVNKFSHAPSSAFQPVPRNFNVPTDENHHRSTSFRPIPDKETHRKQNEDLPEITKSVLQINDTKGSNRLFLYSPKPLHNRESVSPTSPGFAKPWVGNTGESRVLTLAAKKFENPVAQPNSSFQPRRLSREKINAIPNFQMSNNEKLTAPYLVKSLEQPSNTVRKLSGQYDNLGYQPNRFERSPQQSAFPSNKKLVDGFQPKFTVPQNYSIRYDRPKVNTERFPPVHNTTPAEVKKYNQFHPEKQTTSQYYAPRHDHNFCRVTQPSSHQTHSEIPNNYERRLSNQKLNQIVTKEEYDHDDPHTKEQPKYQAQTRIKTEVYDNPRIEINDLEKETGKNEGSRPSYVSQSSVESLKEYGAISSRVMSGPVAQVASTVKQKSPMTRNEHDIQAAFALKSALQKVNNATSPNPQPNTNRENLETSENYRRESRNQENTDRPHERNVIFNNVRSNNQHLRSEERPRAPTKPSVSESHEMTARGEHIVTGKLPLHPSINVQPSFNKPTQAQLLSKSDSWHQICLMNQAPSQNKPAPRSAPSTRNIMKSKSTHSVIPAKQFEAGMTKDEVAEKRRTMEAFFGGGYASQQQSKSPSPGKVVKRAINRTKTSEKNVQYKQYQTPEMPTGLARSRTLPDIVCLDLLDENNVDQAFEDLFTSS